MDLKDINIHEAAKAFGVTHYAIKKWLKGERTPRPAMQKNIRKVTRNSVQPNDWASE